MFFCESCREKNNWPGIFISSRGRCEVCGVVSDCYDVKSSNLPLPKKKEDHIENENLSSPSKDMQVSKRYT